MLASHSIVGGMPSSSRESTRRARTRTHLTWITSVAMLVILAFAAHSRGLRAVDDAVVRTDRLSYPAGDDVIISAAGFLPNDTVTLQVIHADGTAESGAGHEPVTLTTDATGAVTTTWTIDPRDLAPADFKAVVYGSAGPVESAVFHRRAAVTTERDGYPAMATIGIWGRGFLPGETVTLQVTHADGTTEGGGGHDPWTAIAGGDGLFQATWYIDAADATGDSFVLQATGSSTGLASTAVFKRTGVVQTDKFDYMPGETAVITGYGFAASETVTLQITHMDGRNDGNGHTPFDVMSDGDGRLTATWYVDPDDSLGSKFLLTATGALSARTAAYVFWDASPNLVISQVYGAGGNAGATFRNDFVELFNRGSASVALDGMSIQYASATGTGNFAANPVVPLTGTLLPGQYYLVGLASGGANGVTFTADATGTINAAAAAGKVVLVNTTTGLACNGGSAVCSTAQLGQIVDLVGFGNANFFEGLSPAPAPSATNAIFRGANGCTDTDSNATDFVAAAAAPRNTQSPLAPCAGATTPNLTIGDVSITEGNSGTSSASFTVSLSSPAPAGGVTFDIATADGTASAPVDYATVARTAQSIPAGSSTYVFTVVVNGDTTAEDNETFLVNVTNVVGATVADGQGQGTITNDDIVDPCTLPVTAIGAIQGSGAAVAITTSVRTRGIVVGDYEGAAPGQRGFFIQDAAGDGNPATSDGIFVFDAQNRNLVSLGQDVVVSGTPGENQGQSQISLGTTGTVTICGTGTVTPVDVTLPVATADALESYEGMMVRLPQTLYVTEHFQLGRFGQVVLSSTARLPQPTHVATPGAPAATVQAQNDRNRIILDDELQNQNPDPIAIARGGLPLSAANTLRGGDSATGIVGLLNYTWAGNAASGNAYRIRARGSLNGSALFEPTNPRPVVPPAVGGSLRVVGMNLLNFFNTFDGLPDTVDNCRFGLAGAPADCRGADSQAEFDRQWPKTVVAIVAMNPDVLAVNELENDGYGADSAVQFLVDRLNAATAPGTYAFIDADANTGQVNAMGTDAIKSALLFKPAAVTPVGQTAVLNTVAFVNGGDSGPRGRPSIAQAFQVNSTAARFIVDANHFKSKGSACDLPDQNDGQDNCAAVRTNAARELVTWLASDPTGTGDPDVLIVGDLNSYAQEDPVTTIRNAGYTNLIESRVGTGAYSYVFDGQWGYLDHALASASLDAQVTGVGEYHVNADEPSVLDYNTDFKTANLQASLYAADEFRISDHDPVIVGLTLNAPPSVTAGPFSVDEGGTVLLSAVGSDANGDVLTYTWDLDNDGTFETGGNPVTFNAGGLSGPSTRTVAVRVTDPLGLSASTTATVAILNVAPILDLPVVSPEPSVEGQPIAATVTFRDPAGSLDAPFICTVDFGDQTPAVAGIVSGTQCAAPPHTYPAFGGSYKVAFTISDKDGGSASAFVRHAVLLNWTGFFRPVDNLPAVNVVKAGSAVPLKFSLGGNKGLAILAAGYPRSALVACGGGGDPSNIVPTVGAGQSPLTYDPVTRQYSYEWKTDRQWANSCRELQLKLIDGSTHYARFRFTR